VCVTPAPAYILTDSGARTAQSVSTYAEAPRVQTVRNESGTRFTDYRAWQIETELAARAKAADAAYAAASKPRTPSAPPANVTYVVEAPQGERHGAGTTAVATRAPLPDTATTTTPASTTTAVASR